MPPCLNSAALTRLLPPHSTQVRMWLQAPALPQARDALAAAVLDGCIYALGGKFSPLNRAVAGAPNGLVLDTVDRLDPREPSWQSLRPMLTPRAGLAATVLDGRLLALGGIGTDGQVLSSTECYEPRMNQWAPFQPLLQPRYGLQAVTLSPGGPDERVMVMGGMTSNNFNDGEEANAGPVALRRVSRGAALSSTEAWDSDSGSWRLNDAHMHQPRFWFAAAAMEVTVPPR